MGIHSDTAALEYTLAVPQTVKQSYITQQVHSSVLPKGKGNESTIFLKVQNLYKHLQHQYL